MGYTQYSLIDLIASHGYGSLFLLPHFLPFKVAAARRDASGSDGSDSGRSQSVSQASRGRTDTGDTVGTVGTVNSMGSVDSTTMTMQEFDEILRNNSRLMVTL